MAQEMDRLRRIEAALRTAFEPEQLEVHDESHRHRGHAGAAGGGGHYRVRIVSPRFAGESRLVRHRMVYAALEKELESDVHALAIQAYAPDECPD